MSFDDEPVVDKPTLDRLMGELDKDTVMMIVQNFIEDCKEYQQDIPHLYRQKDWEVLHRKAHSMKSSAASLGALRLSSLGGRLEAAATEEKEASIDTNIKYLDEMIQDTISAYKEL